MRLQKAERPRLLNLSSRLRQGANVCLLPASSPSGSVVPPQRSRCKQTRCTAVSRWLHGDNKRKKLGTMRRILDKNSVHQASHLSQPSSTWIQGKLAPHAVLRTTITMVVLCRTVVDRRSFFRKVECCRTTSSLLVLPSGDIVAPGVSILVLSFANFQNQISVSAHLSMQLGAEML